jgi:hypothetical protein
MPSPPVFARATYNKHAFIPASSSFRFQVFALTPEHPLKWRSKKQDYRTATANRTCIGRTWSEDQDRDSHRRFHIVAIGCPKLDRSNWSGYHGCNCDFATCKSADAQTSYWVQAEERARTEVTQWSHHNCDTLTFPSGALMQRRRTFHVSPARSERKARGR